MSGPKTSRYTLTPEQRRILAEQRRIERRKAAAFEKIKRDHKRMIRLESGFDSRKAVAEELSNRGGSDGGFSEKLAELKKLAANAERIISKMNADDVVSLEAASSEIGDLLSSATGLASDIEKIAEENDKKLKSELSDDIDKGFDFSFESLERLGTKEDVIREKARDRLEEVRNTGLLPKRYVDEIGAALEQIDGITDGSFLKNYVSVVVSPLLKKCGEYVSKYREVYDEFETLYSEYTSLCNLYYLVPQEYDCSADSLGLLKAEIARIKETADEDDEQSYISECIDEVMEEMGYSVMGSREYSKKNGRRFRSELYSFSDGTAVSVTSSSDGKIAMELGGIDHTDRLPDGR